MSYSDLSDSDKQRLGAAFFNIKDQKSAMSKDKVDWDSATTDFTLNGREITSASFQTSITRMKKDWSKLSNTEKHRLAAAFFHMNPDHRKSIMGRGIDWAKASNDFKPKTEGKPISAASFRTSITRLLINYTPGKGVSMGTPSRKRKAATISASPAESARDTAARKRTKTARTAAAAAEAESNNTHNSEGPNDNDDDDDDDDDDYDGGNDQDDDSDQADGPANATNDNGNESPQAKTEQSEWLGGDDMFGGDPVGGSFLSFLPVT